MSDSLRVTMVDNQPTLQLPSNLAEQLQVESGGEIVAISSDEGVILVPVSVEIAEQSKVLNQVMVRRREALHKLAE